ncbi:Spy/CpxP family protein refolding chaperone [Microbulbifer sp.]|uniref:Spy/CpxP family protein refolding chaperone n=1 Tax=Microbulbifer sp. TaxID=1908541 RepID=UPI003F398375
MNRWKATLGSLALASVLAVPAVTLAQDDFVHPSMSRHHGSRFLEHMEEELGLTEGQVAQLKANREVNRDARKAQRKQVRELRKQLREAIDSGADQGTLDELGAQLGKLHVAKMQEMRQVRQQFEAILTEEQKARLKQLKEERGGRRHFRRWKERDEE